MKTKKPQRPLFELMPRDAYDEALEGLSYEDYLESLNEHPFKELIDKIPLPGIDREFGNKINYLIDTVGDMTTRQTEIKELWKLCFEMIAARETDLQQLVELDVYPLVSLTIEAEFSHDEKQKIDDNLIEAVKNYFAKLLKSSYPFADKIRELNAWSEMHNRFLSGLGLTNQVGTFKYLKSIIESNITDFEALKSTSPITFLRYVEVLKAMYKSTNADYKVQIKGYYLRKCLEQIIVARNAGLYDGYDQLLRDYYTAKLEDRPRLNWCFDNLAGYGEKPWKLVWLFLGVNIVFALLFTFLPFEFKDAPTSVPEKFFTFIYFNNTTMLTVGYGDIYPKGIGARIVVALLQIVGFAISGTAVALFLRRLLRF